MKINFAKLKSFARKARLLLLPAAALLATLAAGNSYAAQKFPDPTVNDWDCVTTGGGQDGILFLHFTDDIDPDSGFRTFEGMFAQAGARRVSGDPRSNGGDTGRTPQTNVTSTVQNLFGGGSIQGTAGTVEDNGGPNDWFADSRGLRGIWGFNSKGQLVGFYFTVENTFGVATNFQNTCTNIPVVIPLTNATVFSTNIDVCFTNESATISVSFGPFTDGEGPVVSNFTLVNTNFFLTPIGITNDVSFSGTISGKRMNLLATSTVGNFNVRGVPLQEITAPVTDFTWSGEKIQDGTVFQELFTMFPDPVIPNLFDLDGQGSSYNYTNAFCLISSQKKIGIVLTEVPDGGSDIGPFRGTIGAFKSSKNAISAKTTGFTTATPNPIRFNASAVPEP